MLKENYKKLKLLLDLDKSQFNRLEFFTSIAKLLLLHMIFAGASVVVLIVPSMLTAGVMGLPGYFWMGWVILVFMFLVAYMTFFIYLIYEVSLRRVKDIGISKWWLLIILIPYLNCILFLYLLLKKSPLQTQISRGS